MSLLLPTHHLSTQSSSLYLNFSTTTTTTTTTTNLSNRRNLYKKPNRISLPLLRVSLNSNQNSTPNEYLDRHGNDDVLWGKDSDTVEVIGIGSRKDAVLDFCLDSSFQSSFSHLRYWTIILNDSSAVQLQQRSIEKDIVLRNMDLPAFQFSPPRTVILVASAGYGLDHIAAIELLGAVKSSDGLAVGIVLMPFSFEGQRRQEEAKELIDKLRENTNFCIVVDTDVLLKKEVVTLAEALKSANNAVLLSINSIFVLMSERHMRHFDCPHDIKKQLEVPELLKHLESSEASKVGFGAGNNIKLSIARAVFECPFIADDVKELNGVAICTLACAVVVESSNWHSFMRIFRQTTGWQKEIVLSVIHEPNLEPDLFVTTIILCGIKRENISKRNGFLSGLAQRFPFFFSLLGGDYRESKEPLPENSVDPCVAEDTLSLGLGDILNSSSIDGKSENSDQCSDDSSSIENPALSEGTEAQISRSSDDLNFNVYDQISKGEASFQRGALIGWSDVPSFHIAEEWAKERAAISGANSVLVNQCIYPIPVGVKPSGESVDRTMSSSMQSARPRISNDMKEEAPRIQNTPSWDALTDAGLGTVLRGTHPKASKKPGLLSKRAASMLESERDSEKKWAPTTQMQFQGGIYRGRCQGGLPEGKGCLTLVDGSIYDGMWRFGKKSGVGAFYFSNGDVYQGSWRDDLMHGKGWFYFHSGDRWFANFWKGKANGEGRFYAKNGEIFFGHFQNGWRHGRSLCISADGVRWAEIWDQGVLLDRQLLDSK